jgi:CRISPR system Cascade subunit CasA
MQALAPNFIEVCWRVRCIWHHDRLACRYTTTGARRCLPEIEGGDVGDPWIPIGREDAGALTVGPSGLNYRLLTTLIFETDFAPAVAQNIQADDGELPLFVASALARGQGKTEGLHERVLPLPPGVRTRMRRPEDRAAIGKRAMQRVEAAANMRRKVLFPALKQLALGGTPMPDNFDAGVDAIFFEHLFGTLDLPDGDASLAFANALLKVAVRELERAIARTSSSSARRFKAISAAERMFYGCLHKTFQDLSLELSAKQGAPA